MTKRSSTPREPAAYIDELVFQLRLLDVPGDRTGQILAETESHLAESGEDPAETFGDPQDYARELAAREGVTLRRVARSSNVLIQFFSTLGAREWVKIVAGATFVGMGTHIGLGGLSHLVFGSTVPFGLDPWLAILVGVAVLGGWLLVTFLLIRGDPSLTHARVDRSDGTTKASASTPERAAERHPDYDSGPMKLPRSGYSGRESWEQGGQHGRGSGKRSARSGWVI